MKLIPIPSPLARTFFSYFEVSSHLIALPLILMVADTAIPPQVQVLDFMAVQAQVEAQVETKVEETCCFD